MSGEPGRSSPGTGTPPGETVHRQFDWSAVAPSTAVVEAVAKTVDREETALETLYGTVDPDALDALVRSGVGTAFERDVAVSFPFADRQVTVRSTGDVLVEPGT